MENSTDYRKKEERYCSEQIEIMYRGYGKYFTDIIRSMSDKIMNWAFALNTGGLFATVAFMGAVIKSDSNLTPSLKPFVFIILIFSLGILFIVKAAILEHKRFEKKGELLEGCFNEYNCSNDEKTAADNFLAKMPPETPCYDCVVSKLECVSYLLFFVGMIVALFFLICKGTT